MKLFTSLDLCDRYISVSRLCNKSVAGLQFYFNSNDIFGSSRTSRNHIIRIVSPYEVDIANLLAASKHIQQIWSNISIHLASCFWPPDEFSLYI